MDFLQSEALFSQKTDLSFDFCHHSAYITKKAFIYPQKNGKNMDASDKKIENFLRCYIWLLIVDL